MPLVADLDYLVCFWLLIVFDFLWFDKSNCHTCSEVVYGLSFYIPFGGVLRCIVQWVEFSPVGIWPAALTHGGLFGSWLCCFFLFWFHFILWIMVDARCYAFLFSSLQHSFGSWSVLLPHFWGGVLIGSFYISLSLNKWRVFTFFTFTILLFSLFWFRSLVYLQFTWPGGVSKLCDS